MPTDEQAQTHAEQAPAAVAERDALMAAANAAMAEESTETGTEESETPVPAVKTKPANDVEPEVKPSSLKQILAKREREQRLREESTKYAREQYSEIEAMRAQLASQREELENQKRSLSEQEARHRVALTDPTKMAELYGKTTEQMINEMTISGSPEHKVILEQKALLDDLRKELEGIRGFTETQKKSQEEAQHRARAEEIHRGEQLFVGQFADLNKYPTINSEYERAAKVTRMDKEAIALMVAKSVQNAYYKKTGNLATDEEILEYMESEAKEGIGAILQKTAGSAIATKSTANGPRTLSASSASQRRATPKPVREMTAAEERMLLMDIANEAMRTAT